MCVGRTGQLETKAGYPPLGNHLDKTEQGQWAVVSTAGRVLSEEKPSEQMGTSPTNASDGLSHFSFSLSFFQDTLHPIHSQSMKKKKGKKK